MKIRRKSESELEITVYLRQAREFLTTCILNDVCGTEERGQCRALVNMVMDFRAP